MRYLTAGESHGPQLTVIIEGVPSGLTLTREQINEQLARRQKGHGRGRRMQIEKDEVEITSGVRHGVTLGSPIALVVKNRDWTHWTTIMGADALTDEELENEGKRAISRPRPGHADLNGAIKYNHRDMRNVLERSSARETTVRVAVGAVAQVLLQQLGVEIGSHVRVLGGVEAVHTNFASIAQLKEITEGSSVRCLDPEKAEEMIAAIDDAKANGDTIGGVCEVIATGMPVGVGSYVHFDRKLDARVAMSVVSINAFKGVEFGIGFEAGYIPGSKVHDEIVWNEEDGYTRSTNRLGGFEGGMTTGMPIVVRGVMKPIPTLYKPLQSVDIHTKEPFTASIERSDACAVPAAAVVMENVVAFELANALLEQFGSDEITRIQEAIAAYKEHVARF
ncbi:MAG: chorismate synthase [Bacilli bacterium]